MLRNIIRELKGLREEEKLDIDDNTLFQESVRIFNTRYIQDNKKQFYSDINPREFKERPKEEPATEKQVLLLKRMKKYKEGITKKEAYSIISESAKNRKKSQEVYNADY